MNVAVRVSPEILRGTSFKSDASILHNLVGERFAVPLNVDDVDVVLAEPTAVLLDGWRAEGADARAVLEVARTITSPAVKDG